MQLDGCNNLITLVKKKWTIVLLINWFLAPEYGWVGIWIPASQDDTLWRRFSLVEDQEAFVPPKFLNCVLMF